MKKQILLFFSVLLSGAAWTQNTNSLLWEISGNGLQSPTYLFGTYHLITSTFLDSFPVIREKFEQTKGMTGELVMDSGMTSKVMEYALMKDSSLDQLLSPAEYTLVSDFLKETAGMPLTAFNKVKPVLVSTLLMAKLLPAQGEGTAMDLWFQDLAKKEGKPVYGLESADEQARLLFNSIPLKRQAQQLVESVKDKDKTRKELLRLNACYRAQDMDCLAKSMSDGEGFSAAEMKDLLESRNLRWLEKLPAMMEHQPLFIAVGAGHLTGDTGLLNLLRKKGYAVKAVMMK